MRIILCRHGETDYNAERRLQGKLETGLNANGLKQAKLVANLLKKEKFDAIFCSTQKRCRMTAKEIMKFHKNKVNFRDGIREVDLGIYSGMNHKEIEEKFPGKWSQRVDNKYDFHHKGGESYKSADETRVQPLLEELKEKYSSRAVLVITHQGIGILILGNLLGLPKEKVNDISIPNDTVYYIDYLPHKTEVKYVKSSTMETGFGCLMRSKS